MLHDNQNRMVTSICSELRDLGIYPAPDRATLLPLVKRFEMGPLVVAGVQNVPVDNGLQPVRYEVLFERHRVESIPYFYGAKLVVSLDSPIKGLRVFDLKGDEYFSLRQAVNLLCGRPVYKLSFLNGGVSPQWYQLSSTSRDSQGNSVMQKIPYVQGKVENTLDSIPINDLPGLRETILDSLFNGDRVAVPWKDGENARKTFLQVQPPDQTITAFSTLDTLKQNISDAISNRRASKQKGGPSQF